MNAILALAARLPGYSCIRVAAVPAVALVVPWSQPSCWHCGVAAAAIRHRRRIYSNVDAFAALAGLGGCHAPVPAPAADLLLARRCAALPSNWGAADV